MSNLKNKFFGCFIGAIVDVEDLILKCEQLYQLRLELNK